MVVLPRPPIPGGNMMSMEEFKKCLKKFDVNGDGRINKEELREFIRHNGGGWFMRHAMAKRVIEAVDTNCNGFIDDNEIDKLQVFAIKLGFQIVTF